jgi:hypothetical protein
MIGVDHSTNSTEFTALSGELIDAAHKAFNWAATGRAHPTVIPAGRGVARSRNRMRRA